MTHESNQAGPNADQLETARILLHDLHILKNVTEYNVIPLPKALEMARDKASNYAQKNDIDLDTIDHRRAPQTESELTHDYIMSHVSYEMLSSANQAITAMAEKFNVSKQDFSLVRTQSASGQEVINAVYSAGSGIDLSHCNNEQASRRSWNKIFGWRRSKDFEVKVGGNERPADSRLGMTEAVYRAMIEQKRAEGTTLPDSAQVTQNGGDRMMTLLTGEHQSGNKPLVAHIINGSIVVDEVSPSVGTGLGFRPCVTIPSNPSFAA